MDDKEKQKEEERLNEQRKEQEQSHTQERKWRDERDEDEKKKAGKEQEEERKKEEEKSKGSGPGRDIKTKQQEHDPWYRGTEHDRDRDQGQGQEQRQERGQGKERVKDMSEYRGAHQRQQEQSLNKLRDQARGIQPLNIRNEGQGQNIQHGQEQERDLPDNFDRNGNFAPSPSSARDFRTMDKEEKIRIYENKNGIYHGYDNNDRQVYVHDVAGRPQAAEWRVNEDGRIQMKDGGERTQVRERAPGGDRTRVNVGNHKWQDVDNPDRYVVNDADEIGKLKREVDRDEGDSGYDRSKSPKKDGPTRGQGKEEKQPEKHHKEHSKDKGWDKGR